MIKEGRGRVHDTYRFRKMTVLLPYRLTKRALSYQGVRDNTDTVETARRVPAVTEAWGRASN